MPVTSPAEPLRRLLGDAVLAGAAARRFSVGGVAPGAVVAPADVEQVAAVLAVARENGWTVEPAGAGTWLTAGRRPRRADLVLSTDRLRGIHEYEPADLTIGAGAGLSLSALEQAVAQHRQVLPLDPPGSVASTLGATFATASAGPLRLGLGSPRDHALGLEIVTGDGRVLRLGGRVVKNVAGYDLVRLLVGSRGSLGIITRLHVRLRPLPERDLTLVLVPADGAAACALAAEVHSAALPVALEVVSPGVTRRALNEESWALLVRLQGNADTVRDAVERTHAAARTAVRPLNTDDAARVWATLREMEGRAGVYLRLADLPTRIAATLELASAVARAGASSHRVNEWAFAAHAGDGIVRMWRATPPADGASTASAVDEARRTLAAHGGTVLAPVGAHLLRADLDPFPEAGTALRLMRELKLAFDPDGVLAPGRFLP